MCKPGEPGELKWTVPTDAPDELYYQVSFSDFLKIAGDIMFQQLQERLTLSLDVKVSFYQIYSFSRVLKP